MFKDWKLFDSTFIIYIVNIVKYFKSLFIYSFIVDQAFRVETMYQIRRGLFFKWSLILNGTFYLYYRIVEVDEDLVSKLIS